MIFPFIKEKKSIHTIDWSTVADDPNEHLVYNVFNDWDQFVDEFQSRGGIELRGKMVEYYNQIIKTETQVDSLIHLSYVINNY